MGLIWWNVLSANRTILLSSDRTEELSLFQITLSLSIRNIPRFKHGWILVRLNLLLSFVQSFSANSFSFFNWVSRGSLCLLCSFCFFIQHDETIGNNGIVQAIKNTNKKGRREGIILHRLWAQIESHIPIPETYKFFTKESLFWDHHQYPVLGEMCKQLRCAEIKRKDKLSHRHQWEIAHVGTVIK